jgi:hypothetical protein
MKLCKKNVDISDLTVDGVHVRCMRMHAPKSVEPLWELVDHGRMWTVITAAARLELREPFSGLAPPEDALLRSAAQLGATLAVNITPPICRRFLLSKQCLEPRAEYAAEDVETVAEAYRRVRELKEDGAVKEVDSIAFVGDVIVLAWSEKWQDKWGL